MVIEAYEVSKLTFVQKSPVLFKKSPVFLILDFS